MLHLKSVFPRLLYGGIAVFVVIGIESIVSRHIPEQMRVSVDGGHSAATEVSLGGHVFEQKTTSPKADMTAPWMSYAEVSAMHTDAYYQVIIENNLFRPLQKHASGQSIFSYRFLGTITKDGERVAYILDTFKRRVHPVKSGEKLDRFVVETITSKSVVLRDTKADVQTKLELDSIFLK